METYVVWEQYFQIKLPNMYVRISCQKEMSVHHVLRSHDGEVHLDLRFKMNLQDWELE